MFSIFCEGIKPQKSKHFYLFILQKKLMLTDWHYQMDYSQNTLRKHEVSSPQHHHKSRVFFLITFFLSNNCPPTPTFSPISQSLTVPSSAAERKKSLEGCVARPQIGPSIWPLIRMLHAAFFSPTSIISAFLVPTRIFPFNNSERIVSDVTH